MRYPFCLLISFFIVICVGLQSPPAWAFSNNIRKPVWDGKFYPAEREQLSNNIKSLTDQAAKTPMNLPAGKKLRALILPHAGYVYSGLTAAHAARVLAKKQFSKVIVAGPDHRVGFINASMSSASAWETPLGRISLSKDAQTLRKKKDLFRNIPESDAREHSIEVVLPFLQYYMGRFEMIPIVLGRGCDIDRIADSVDSVIDQKTLFVASSDLSHYLYYDEAYSRDNETIKKILNLEEDHLLKHQNAACGAVPIAILLNLARRHDWQPVLLHSSNSGDTAGGRSRVVGYAAIAFYGDVYMKKKNASSKSTKRFTKKQGQALVTLARQTIINRFGLKLPKNELDMVAASKKDKKLMNHHATFVTLNKEGALRGCIGSLTAVEPLTESVKNNAINAAFNDYRFPPLSMDEIDKVDIEVSILTEPEPLEYTNAEDLLEKLRPGEDGVIIQKGSARATFLPQVWEQLPEHEEFLSHLCMKAGLPAEIWQNTKLEVLTYQVQYFEEKK